VKIKGMSLRTPKNIVVRMPNWIGDAVMSAPVLGLIKEKWPESIITLFGMPHILSLFEADPNVNFLLPIEKKETVYHLIYKLREKKFDTGILLTNSFSSAWLFFRAHILNRLGFSKDMRKWMLTYSLPYPKEKGKEHHIKTYQSLLSDAGKKEDPTLYIKESERSWANDFLEERGITRDQLIIGVNPSAAFGPSKCWLEERFRETSERLITEMGAHLLFFGDANAYDKNNRINLGFSNTHNLAGKTSLRELMPLIQRCDLFLTNDSGPMHIACALGTPVVALFGSTSPKATGPYKKGVYLYEKADCSPCYKRECPIDFRCMKAITTEMVYQAIESQLNKYSEKVCVKN
jgi:heptosyltransferase II